MQVEAAIEIGLGPNDQLKYRQRHPLDTKWTDWRDMDLKPGQVTKFTFTIDAPDELKDQPVVYKIGRLDTTPTCGDCGGKMTIIMHNGEHGYWCTFCEEVEGAEPI